MNELKKELGIEITKSKGKKIAESNNHSHPYYELIYVRSGSFTYFIENKLLDVGSKNVILVDKNTFHKAIITNDVTNTYLIIRFYEDFIASPFLDDCNDIFKKKQIIIKESNYLLIDLLFSKMYHEYDKKGKNWKILVRYQLCELISILRNISEDTSKSTEYSTQSNIERIVNYINTKVLTENEGELNLESISRFFSMSPTYFSRMFKKQIGIGFKEYIISLKILNAKKLMHSTDLPIMEIAYRSGFSDSNYFATTFKRIEGISPTAYKKSLTNNNIFKHK